MAGLTPTGLEVPNLEELKTQIENALTVRFGRKLNFLPSSVNAIIIGIVADALFSAWQAIASLYSNLDPDVSEGKILEFLCAITGVQRQEATHSQVTLTVNLDSSTNLGPGRLVEHVTTGVLFETTEPVFAFTAGDYEVAAQAVETGPVEASSGTLTVINTPKSGWNSVTNSEAADPGVNRETDAELRLTRLASLAASGSSTVIAIAADVDRVDGVTTVRPYENTSATVDSNGLPPHSFEIVLIGGTADDDEIAQAVWDSKPAGIESYSSSSDSGSATDKYGTHTVPFTRAVTQPVWLTIELEKDPATYAGDSAVHNAILDDVESGTIGGTIYASALIPVILTVPGVKSVTNIRISDDGFSPNYTKVTLSYNATPEFSAGKMNVTANDI